MSSSSQTVTPVAQLLTTLSPLTPPIEIHENSDNPQDGPEAELDQLDSEGSENSDSETEDSATPVNSTRQGSQNTGLTKQNNIAAAPVTAPKSQVSSLPASTPRPFPLTPPQPSQILLDESVSRTQTPDGANDSHSDSDSLPEVADMLARTRPTYSSQANQRRSTTARDGVMRDVKTSASGTLPRTPVKRQDTESPRVPKLSRKPSYNIVETPERTYIEILDSDSECACPIQVDAQSVVSTTLPNSSPLSSPKQQTATQGAKLKRKRTEPPGQTTAPISAIATQARPSKRPKTKKAAYRKHETHWNLDGNVLVQIKDTCFKLQRSRLVRHSEWFKHTFDRIEDGEKVAEWDSETKILCLDQTGVSVDDFVTLLDAMEEAITFIYKPPPFRVMASILRASSFLSFNDFEQWASEYLEDMWSPDLADLTTERIAFATESIALARHCNLLSTLKRAMYELVRLEGFGQVEEADSDDERSDCDVENVELSPADFKALVKARERLTSLWLLTATSSKIFPTCSGLVVGPTNDSGSANVAGDGTSQTAVTGCIGTNKTLSMQAHAKLVIESGIYEEYHADPMCGFQALIDAPWAEEGFCDACIDTRKKAWASGREKAWENLGLWFGLD